VFEDHLRLRLEGRTEEDIQKNYSDAIVLLSGMETVQGKDALRRWADDLARDLPEASFEYVAKQVNDEYAFLHWRAQAASAHVRHGVDSFVIRDGLIVMQSVYYPLE
jgi:hypothetical protein